MAGTRVDGLLGAALCEHHVCVCSLACGSVVPFVGLLAGVCHRGGISRLRCRHWRAISVQVSLDPADCMRSAWGSMRGVLQMEEACHGM